MDSGVLRHLGQPELTSAITGACSRTVGDAWLWDRKSSDVDISPLVAGTIALWALTTFRKKKTGGLVDLTAALRDDNS
jgi:hypothetical protein